MRPVTVPWPAVGRGLAFGAVAAIPVALLAYLVASGVEPVVELDEEVIRRATDLTRPHLDVRSALLTWQEAMQPRWVYPAAGLVCVWAWRRHGLRSRALWAGATLAGTWVLSNAAKEIVRRARPVVEEAVSHAAGLSFPSGHAVAGAAVTTTLTLLLWPVMGPVGRVVVPTVGGTFALLTAADRVLLGVHYPSDVLAGILFGVAVVGSSYYGYRHAVSLRLRTAQAVVPPPPPATEVR